MGRSRGARRRQKGVGEQIKHQASKKNTTESQTLRLGLFSSVLVQPAGKPHVDIHLVYAHRLLFARDKQEKHGLCELFFLICSWFGTCVTLTWPSSESERPEAELQLRPSNSFLRFPAGFCSLVEDHRVKEPGFTLSSDSMSPGLSCEEQTVQLLLRLHRYYSIWETLTQWFLNFSCRIREWIIHSLKVTQAV